MLCSVFGMRTEVVSKSSAFGRDSVRGMPQHKAGASGFRGRFVGYGVSTGVTERRTARVLPGSLRTMDSNSRPPYSYRTR